MKKKIIIGIVVIAAILLISTLSGVFSKKPDTNEPIKIGLSLPLTGGAAFLGESAKQAAELALKDAGNTKYNYSLVFEDDAFNPTKTVTTITKFINVDKVWSIITFGSGTSNASAPVNENAKIPRFGLASDPTSAVGEYNFIHWTPAYKEGDLLVKEIDKRAHKTVAIVDANHPGTMAVSGGIKKALETSNVKLTSYNLTNVGDKDFRTLITKLKGENPEIVALVLFSPEIELFTKQAKDLGAKFKITSAESFEWSNEPELYEGMWFVGDSVVPQEFTDKFVKTYGHTPKPGSAYVYDLVTLMIRSQENSKNKLSSEDFAKMLNKDGEYNSVLFGKTKIDKDGLFITEASVKVMKNKQAEFVK